MNKLSILLLSASVSFGGIQMYAHPFRIPAKLQKETRKAQKKSSNLQKVSAKAAEAAANWCAGSVKAYGWDGSQWVLDDTYSFKYDDRGNTTEQYALDADGAVNRETFTYNSNNLVTTSFSEYADAEGEEMTPAKRLSREYDSVVTNFITFNNQEVWTGDEWIPSNNYKQTVTRNADGNVISMERAVFFQGIYDPTYRLLVTYGADGKATRIVESDLDYDYDSNQYIWVEGDAYDKIVWENTDGQIVQTNDLYSGLNRIKSAILYTDDMTINLNVEYDGENFTATLTYVSDDPEDMESIISSLTCEVLSYPDDEHGKHGWKYTTITEESYEGETEKEIITETYLYDEYDLIILEQVDYSIGKFSGIDSKIEGTIRYNKTYGYPVTWTVQEYDYKADIMYNAFMAEYSDYIDANEAGISHLESDDNSDVKFFNLQGQQVNNPKGGIYIKVANGKSSKVYLPK